VYNYAPCLQCDGFHELQNSINFVTISYTTEGDGGDFLSVTCTTTFTAGSVPGTLSTPPCAITINNDSTFERNETFSLNVAILSSNGQSTNFADGAGSVSATILDDDSKSVVVGTLIHWS